MSSFLKNILGANKGKKDASQLIHLFGHSVYHPAIDGAFKAFKFPSPDKSKLKRYDSVKSEYYNITFTFWYKRFYQQMINTPKSTYKGVDEEEVILHEMTFSAGTGDCLWPYGLNAGDSSDLVIEKLGSKPHSKSKNFDGDHTWMFYNHEFKIMPVFGDDLHLKWLRIWAITLSDKKKLAFAKELKSQNKNISGDRFPELIALKDTLPTIAWQHRMDEGDDIFTQANIGQSEQLLNEFIDALTVAAKSKKATSVYNCVKKAVNGFNKLNKGDNSFIDTSEREELVLFMETAIALTGFKITDGVDITEDIREW